MQVQVQAQARVHVHVHVHVRVHATHLGSSERHAVRHRALAAFRGRVVADVQVDRGQRRDPEEERRCLRDGRAHVHGHAHVRVTS